MGLIAGVALILALASVFVWLVTSMWKASDEAYADYNLWLRWITERCNGVESALSTNESARAMSMHARYVALSERRERRSQNVLCIRVRLF